MNVVSAAFYHNLPMPTWLSASQSSLSVLEMRNEIGNEAYSGDWSAVTSVAAMLGVVPELCAAPPGVVMPDLRPHYLLESS